jgi:hypothetical protein
MTKMESNGWKVVFNNYNYEYNYIYKYNYNYKLNIFMTFIINKSNNYKQIAEV